MVFRLVALPGRYSNLVKPTLAILLASCIGSAHADATQPSPSVPPIDAVSCDELANEYGRLSGRINELELDSIRGAKGKADAATVKQLLFFPALFLGSPPANADEYQWLKSQSEAIERAMAAKHCGSETGGEQATVLPSSVVAGLKPSERNYAAALDELDAGKPIRGVWARALAESNGNDGLARSIYLKVRAQQLADESAKK